MIYIFSTKNDAALKRSLGLKADKKTGWVELFTQIPIKHTFTANDLVYLDISGFNPADYKKSLTAIKKSPCVWGIIDPKGAAEDPASFFFEGAVDYIGPGLIKAGLNKKRFTNAISWASDKKAPAGDKSSTAKKLEPEAKAEKSKLPAGKFEGWKSIRAGTTGHFFFLYVSLSGKSNLRAKIGENAFSIVKKRFRDVLQHWFAEAEALLWMETEDASLLLVPPNTANARAAIHGALRMILNSRVISFEKFSLSVPVDFTFAMHYGKTSFQAPGKTGTVISESVNFIFHLGTKKAEPGRLSISDEVPEELLGNGLKDLFIDDGDFQGARVKHSKRFVYE